MKFAIAIPQFYADGEFDPTSFREYFARAEELGFESAWTQESTLGFGPQLSPIETMTTRTIEKNSLRRSGEAALGRGLMARRPCTRRREPCG